MDNDKLAWRVKRVCCEVNGGAVEAVVGRDVAVIFIREEVVEGKGSEGEEEVPEVEGKVSVETGQN